MKDGYYFQHDYNARSDKKLVKLSMKYPECKGIGIYWCIVEMLYEEKGYLLRNEYERISFELRTTNDTIKDVIENYQLFVFDDEKFWSESVLSRLKLRENKSIKAKESISKRWEKYERNTNVKETINESNTNKEKKRKEKENIEPIDLSFIEPEYKNAFETFLQYKKDRKESYKTKQTILAAYMNLKLLSDFNPENAVKVVNQTMANNWKGLFKLKEQVNTNQIKPKYDLVR
jgi:Domain of unknown function (DUF4373)